jgi:hypothetical protein
MRPARFIIDVNGSMKELPGPKKERLWDKKWVVEALNVVPALGTAVVAALIAAADASRRPYFGILAGLAAALGMASIVKVLHARGQDLERKRPEDHIGLQGALHVLHAVVRREGGLGEGPDDRLRVTIHRVVHEGKPLKVPRELEQMLPYICRTGGGQHRRFRIESGIIGKAARECALFSASRESTDFETAVRELVSDWAYTEADARKLQPDRLSWMAIPVIYPGESAAVAVVYLDSSERDFFTKELQNLVSVACAGISSFLPKAY